jgi:multidrug efflux system membrane fusion protein
MSALPPLPPEASPRARRRANLIVIAIVLVLAAAVAWYFWGRSEADTASTRTEAAKSGKAGKGAGKGGRFGGGDPNRAQPVAVAVAKVGDVNIVQTALGTVNALRTVTVRPRVDGMLARVDFEEGQLAKAGDLIAQIDPVPFQVQLAQAEGNLARDAALLNNARLDLDRYRTLLTQDSIAAQQVDQQASQVRQLEGTVKVDQAQVDSAKLQLSYTRISAPISGRLGLRVVDAGNMVRGSDTTGVAVITQVDPISVVFTIPQDTLPRVLARLRNNDKPAVEAWDRDNKIRLASGTLVSTDNQIDVTTGTVRLKAQFANPEGKLFPNQFVNVRMVIDVRKGVIVVPGAAVQRGNQGNVVYVVTAESAVAIRPVTTGPAEGLVIAIESGLQAGERVIVDGVDRIREGAKVEVTEPGTGLRAPGAGPQRAPGEGMDPKKREELKKKLEAMTPEQREEFRKRRQEAREGGAEKKTQ